MNELEGYAIYTNPIFSIGEEVYNLESKKVLDNVYARYKVILDTCLANPSQLVNTNTLEVYDYNIRITLNNIRREYKGSGKSI